MDISIRDKELYAFGRFVVDPLKRLLLRDDVPIPLSPKVFDTLLYLIENPDRLLDKDELLDAIWPGRIVEENNLSQNIFQLRKALEDAGEPERCIVTSPGRGYRFTAPLRRIPRETYPGQKTLPIGIEPTIVPSGAPSASNDVGTPDAQADRMPASSRFKPSLRVVLACTFFFLIVAAGALYAVLQWRNSQPAADRNVVVLADFVNSTGDTTFDTVLGKALQIDLGQSPFLNLVSPQQVRDTLNLMARPADAPLTTPLAQEVCARNQGNTVVGGSITRLGSTYLLTLEATECVSGRSLAQEKVEADSKESVVRALDKLAEQIRSELGESLASIRKFDVPLLQQKTASFDALKAYSEGVYLYGHGQRADSIPLFQHAIELDPNFAAAYADLSSVYYSLNENSLDIANISKAYALRDSVGEREKFNIISRYHQSVTKDLNETIRNFQVWAETYPQDPQPWIKLSNAENFIGQYPQAIEAGKRALAMNPENETAYVVLARAYLHAGDFAEAQAICNQAVAKGLDGDDTHSQLFRIAYARQGHTVAALEKRSGEDKPEQLDTSLGAGVEREMAWAKGKPAERTMLLLAAQTAFSVGQVGRGEELFAQMAELGKRQGLNDFTIAPRARMLADFGFGDRARSMLDGVPSGFDSADYRFTLAEVGNADLAQTILRKDLQQSPADTLLNQVYAPEVRSALALRLGKAAEAVGALRPAMPYDLRAFDIPYLRGCANLALFDGANAASEFRKILNNPGVDPVSPLYNLAHLGLARSLHLQQDSIGSRAEYQKFFTAWKGADPDVPILLQARSEYATL